MVTRGIFAMRDPLSGREDLLEIVCYEEHCAAVSEVHHNGYVLAGPLGSPPWSELPFASLGDLEIQADALPVDQD